MGVAIEATGKRKTLPNGPYLWAALAVGMWAVVPLLRSAALAVPPLQLTAVALAAAAVAGMLAGGRRRAVATQPASGAGWVLAAAASLGAGLALYMAAFALAPAAEVSLIAYVWPILFSLTASLVSGRRPSRRGLLGAAVAFAGTAPLLGGGSAAGGGEMAWLGHLFALASAAAWAVFILLLARKPDLGGARMPAVSLGASILALLAHLGIEASVPMTAQALVVAIIIGAGPYGFACVLWGRALGRTGEDRLTPLAYAVPVLSAGLAIVAGLAVADWTLGLAAIGVIGGAVVARRAEAPAATAASVPVVPAVSFDAVEAVIETEATTGVTVNDEACAA